MKKVCNRHQVAFEAVEGMCVYCRGEEQERLQALLDEPFDDHVDYSAAAGTKVSSYDANGMYIVDHGVRCDHD